MKKLSGILEAGFDAVYLVMGAAIGLSLLLRFPGAATLGGVMALTLSGGDAFHLIPRIDLALTGDRERLQKPLGIGRAITSVTMTIFYFLLCCLAVLLFSPPQAMLWLTAAGFLSVVRVALCLFPQNRWTDEDPPLFWGILRNIPFLLLGVLAILLFALYGTSPELRWMPLAVGLSFLFYLPVVLWSGRFPKVGMLMIPKTCAYLWILFLLLSL